MQSILLLINERLRPDLAVYEGFVNGESYAGKKYARRLQAEGVAGE